MTAERYARTRAPLLRLASGEVVMAATSDVPLMAPGLLAALLAAPPYGLRRLAARHRPRRSEP